MRKKAHLATADALQVTHTYVVLQGRHVERVCAGCEGIEAPRQLDEEPDLQHVGRAKRCCRWPDTAEMSLTVSTHHQLRSLMAATGCRRTRQRQECDRRGSDQRSCRLLHGACWLLRDAIEGSCLLCKYMERLGVTVMSMLQLCQRHC